MTCELENPQNAQHAEYSEHASRIVQILVLLGGEHERDEIRQYGNEIDEVKQAFEELQLVWARQEAQQVFESEPGDAYGLDDFEYWIVHVVLFLIKTR